jgi:hypothetical protein
LCGDDAYIHGSARLSPFHDHATLTNQTFGRC